MRSDVRARVMAASLTGTGAFHLVRPHVYEFMIPPELGAPRPWIIGSGVVELGIAAMLALPATRRAGGWAAAALFVGILPAHLQTLRATWGQPRKFALAAVRIPFQVPMIRAGLRVARAS